MKASIDIISSIDLNIRTEFCIRHYTSFNATVNICTSMARRAALALAVLGIQEILILMTIFRNSLRISTDTINIRARVYSHLYRYERLVLLFILVSAQMFMVTWMSVIAL